LLRFFQKSTPFLFEWMFENYVLKAFEKNSSTTHKNDVQRLDSTIINTNK
jgi:hypothetical protein